MINKKCSFLISIYQQSPDEHDKCDDDEDGADDIQHPYPHTKDQEHDTNKN